MQYKFENKAVLNLPKKLIIVVTNLFIYFLIIEVSYIYLLLITILIFIGIKFKIPKKTSQIYNGLVKPKKKKKTQLMHFKIN